MKRIIVIICTLFLMLGLSGCGEKRDTYKNLSFVNPQKMVRSDTVDKAFFYDDSTDSFLSCISLYVIDSDYFTYASNAEEEMEGYINYVKTSPCLSGKVEESSAMVDGEKGKMITYKWDYAYSDTPEEQSWDPTYYTEIIIPDEDTIYYFEFETIEKGKNEEAFRGLMKSMKID